MLQVLQSRAGYYIGTTDQDGFPESRISDYFPNVETANKALELDAFTRR